MDDRWARDWGLSFEDMEFLSPLPKSVCLEVALQICSVRRAGRFIEDWADVDGGTVEYVASQLDVQAVCPRRSFSDRTARRYRLEVARYLGLARALISHRTELETWLRKEVCPAGGAVEDMLDQSFQGFPDRRLLPPAQSTLTRVIRTARTEFLDGLLKKISGALSTKSLETLDASLAEPCGDYGFQRLKDDVGAATLDNVLDAAGRRAFIQDLDLPFDVISEVDPSWVKMLTRRVEGEPAIRDGGLVMGKSSVYVGTDIRP